MYHLSMLQARLIVDTGDWEELGDKNKQPEALSATKVYENPEDAASDTRFGLILLGGHSISSQVTWP